MALSTKVGPVSAVVVVTPCWSAMEWEDHRNVVERSCESHSDSRVSFAVGLASVWLAVVNRRSTSGGAKVGAGLGNLDTDWEGWGEGTAEGEWGWGLGIPVGVPDGQSVAVGMADGKGVAVGGEVEAGCAVGVAVGRGVGR